MNPLKILEKNQILHSQRGFLLVALIVSMILNVTLSISFLTKNNRVIVLPGVVSKEFSVEGQVFSEAYIEQMSVFFTHLMLDFTPKNVEYNASILLKNVDPKYFLNMSEYFKNKEKAHKNFNFVSRFDIVNLRIYKEQNAVEIDGVLTSYFGTDKRIEKPAKYILNYTISDGKMMVSGFSQRSGQDLSQLVENATEVKK